MNQPKTLNGETQQNIISQLNEYNKNILLTDYKFPCLFRISKMNLEKKQSLSEKIKKGEEEVAYLDEDIKKLELELIKIQTKRSQIEIRSKVNQVRLNVSDELYNLYFIPAMEEKRARKEAKLKLAAASSTPATNDSNSDLL